MNIVLIGSKATGKSTLGAALAERLGLPVTDTDRLVEEVYEAENGGLATCREIFRAVGEARFRQLEARAVEEATENDWHVIVTGGGAFMNAFNRRRLRDNAVLLYLVADTDTVWDRISEGGLPPWLEGPDGRERLRQQIARRDEVMRPFADVVLDTSSAEVADLVEQAVAVIEQELAVRCRSANTFGDVIRMTSFGESHGRAIGCILEGIRPGVEITEADIQKELDRRKPGQSKVTTQRKEPDTVEILSGVYDGKATGAPIAMVIYNQDADSRKYDEIKHLFRPGHADFTFYRKYGFRDHRGGGRSSGRETATRVAAGAVAMDILRKRGVTIRAHAVEVGGIRAETCDYETIEQNPVRCADPVAAKKMEQAILDARKDRDSVGGVIQLDVDGLPPGLGDPVFAKLDARLAYAIMTIGAIKGVEIGDGFALTRMRGSESNDPMADGGFASNHAGGITGGISTGQTVVLRVAVKPTASIAKEQSTVNLAGENEPVVVGGRHDPCIVPRAVPVIEHMAALVLLDAWEIQARLRPEWEMEVLAQKAAH